MLQCSQCHHPHFLSPTLTLLLPFSHHSLHSPTTLSFSHKPISSSPPLRALPQQWLAQLPELITTLSEAVEDGPIELPPSDYSSSTIFATTDEPSSLQAATSFLLTGAITIFLFRSLRRRAKRAKELKFRSSGTKKTTKEEALESLKAMGSVSIGGNAPPSPVQAFLGGISAGVIAIILYKFTTTIEATLNRQVLPDNFSVRQITITIRTIVNGLCYLATFVFGINSIGLFLYSGQLAINSVMEAPSQKEAASKGEESSGSSKSDAESISDGTESNSSKNDQRSDSLQ